jgi:hypothetical protein
MVSESHFPPGTPVRVKQAIRRRGEPTEIEIVGVIEAWEERPTGSWYVHGKNDKLWLHRLRLRKVDGELTCLVIDENTTIARLERAPA